MRLIDADELTRRIEQSYLTEGEKRLFSVKVRHIPTVHFVDVFNNTSYLNSYRSYSEPEPNKYISRIDTECIMLECPECKSRIIATAFSYAVGTKGYSFCPYCGKDMRGEP